MRLLFLGLEATLVDFDDNLGALSAALADRD
jgi:hypothetical protein